ncbi:MAG: hypothetical protein J6B46_08350 [Parabacteroides sp.]|nr:hypothetical protein [Parabacteroides sp.]
MKQLAGFALMLFAFISCTSITEELGQLENNDVAEGNKEYVVSIGMGGEMVNITDAPLTKASGDDLYGFQVYVKKKGDESASYNYYAYGLFDDISDLSITLVDGYLYKFVATCVIDGKNKINKYYNSSTGIIQYYYPFGTSLQNKFVYATFSGCSDLASPSDFTSDVVDIEPDRYYGEAVNFDPSLAENIDIEMLKCMTGMKLVVSKITEGELVISINNKTYSIAAGDSELEVETVFELTHTDWYALRYLWEYEKISPKQTYSTTDWLTVTHKHSYNINEVVYNDYVTFTRNKQTLIKVNTTTNSETEEPIEGSNKINISLEDAGELQPGEEIIIGDSTTEEEETTEEETTEE